MANAIRNPLARKVNQNVNPKNAPGEKSRRPAMG
jgi:hypothetical protein